jgi:hypothetical protein
MDSLLKAIERIHTDAALSTKERSWDPHARFSEHINCTEATFRARLSSSITLVVKKLDEK